MNCGAAAAVGGAGNEISVLFHKRFSSASAEVHADTCICRNACEYLATTI